MTDWNRRVKNVRRRVADVADDAGSVYDDLRGEVGRRAGKVWRDREDYLDNAISFAGDAGDAVSRRMRTDPVGTIALGIILLWLAGRTLRR